MGRDAGRMRKYLLAPRPPGGALGRRPHVQRPQMVPRDHEVAVREPAREARVSLRLQLLPAGGPVRHGDSQLVDVGARVSHPRAWLDGPARLVTAVLERVRASFDEPWRADPRRGAYARPARCVGRARALFRVGPFPGLGRVQRADQQGGGPLVSYPEDGASHGPGAPSAPSKPAAAVADGPAGAPARVENAGRPDGAAAGAKHWPASPPLGGLDRGVGLDCIIRRI